MNVYTMAPPWGKDRQPVRIVDQSLTKGRHSLETVHELSQAELSGLFFKNAPDIKYLLELGTSLHFVTHSEATRTSHEKANLLGWSLDRIVKTICFFDKQTRQIIMVVVPSIGRIDLKPVGQAMELNADKRLRLLPDDQLPAYMTYGTVNPFMSLGQKAVSRIFLDKRVVDVSINGTEKYDFGLAVRADGIPDNQLSCQMTYANAWNLINKNFPEEAGMLEFSYN